MGWTADELAPLSCQFLRALRGKRSQVAFSRRLGYSSNVSAEWEAGRRCPPALVVLQACKRLGLPLQEGFQQLGVAPEQQPSPLTQQKLAAWLDEQRRGEKLLVLAARAGLSRYQLSRILNGKSHPNLCEFFALLQASTGKLHDFLAPLVAPDSVPLLAQHLREVQASRHLAFEVPWTSAILGYVECRKGSKGELSSGAAGVFGLDRSEVAACLDRLEGAGLIRERDGTYEVVGSLLIDTRARSEQALALRSHWATVAAERIRTRHPQDLIGYNVFTASHRDMQRIAQLQLDFYRRVRAIIADSPAETVGLLNLHLIDWFPSE